jgi:hypothetical protein
MLEGKGCKPHGHINCTACYEADTARRIREERDHYREKYLELQAENATIRQDLSDARDGWERAAAENEAMTDQSGPDEPTEEQREFARLIWLDYLDPGTRAVAYERIAARDAARERRLRELAAKWLREQAEYPDTLEGCAAAAGVRCCANELRAALGGEPDFNPEAVCRGCNELIPAYCSAECEYRNRELLALVPGAGSGPEPEVEYVMSPLTPIDGRQSTLTDWGHTTGGKEKDDESQ